MPRKLYTPQQEEKIFQEIGAQIQEAYGENYFFDNFERDITISRKDSEKITVEVKLAADMTLVKEAADMPYYKGLKIALNEAASSLEAMAVQALIDEYVEEVNTLYFNRPDRTMFLFEIDILNKDLEKSDSNASMVNTISYLCEDGSYSLDMLKIKDDEAVENGRQAVAVTLELSNGQENALSALFQL